MPKLSVAIATYNEEKNIGACLTSVKGFADEIIVVDGGSADNTVVEAKKYAAKVIETDNPPMFHKNKQKAIDRCTGDWILQLDADERVSTDLQKEIASAIRGKEYDGYEMPRKNFFLGRFLAKGGQYPDLTVRLYRRGMGRLPCKSVHEQAVVGGKVGRLENPLLHYPYPDFSHYLEHFNVYTGILAGELSGYTSAPGSGSFITSWITKPWGWFLSAYFRHKGFQDGFPGFVFSFFSALRFPVAHIKYWESKHARK